MEKENKTLNLCEKLAGCPEGTKLWSPIYGECTLVEVRNTCPEIIVLEKMGKASFDKRGYRFSYSEECLIFPSRENRDWDNWECPKPKVERFDPKTLQPFDKILARDQDNTDWYCDFFACLRRRAPYPVVTVSNLWRCCVPYNEDTKHLIDTSDEAPEYYRWWEDK